MCMMSHYIAVRVLMLWWGALRPLTSFSSSVQRPRDDCIGEHGAYSSGVLASKILCLTAYRHGPCHNALATPSGAGPDDPRCVALIEAHKVCLRKEGFKVCSSSSGYV